jgi:BlaI family penicillinase repressor
MRARISEAEWQVMEVVWRRERAGAQEIIGELAESTHWTPATVKTLLNRLVRKGALGFEKEGKSYLYFAKVSAAECRGAEAETFLDRIFQGSLAPMIAHFASSRKLSRNEIAELERLLRQGKEK